MTPTLDPGQIIVASILKPPKVGSIVVARLTGGREVIKRLTSAGASRRYALTGDNPHDSTNYTPTEITEIYGGLLWPRV